MAIGTETAQSKAVPGWFVAIIWLAVVLVALAIILATNTEGSSTSTPPVSSAPTSRWENLGAPDGNTRDTYRTCDGPNAVYRIEGDALAVVPDARQCVG